MKKLSKIVSIVMVSFMLLGILLSGLSAMEVFGAEGTSVETEEMISERWGKPTFIAGAGLSEQEIKETEKLLGITNSENVILEYSTMKDLIRYLGSGSGDDSSMISSVLVNRENEGVGISVEIITPQNIGLTAENYMNPLVTAGITDATVKVASIKKVSGESALTGVYKAFEQNGEEIDVDRAKVAQEELTVATNVGNNIIDNVISENEDLTEEEKNKLSETYLNKLNQSLVEIKKELAEIKEKQKDNITEEDIERIINKALENYGLTSYVNTNDMISMARLSNSYLETPSILNKDSLKQLDGLSKQFEDLGNKLGGLTDKFTESSQGFFSKVVDWFSNLWESIVNIFKPETKEKIIINSDESLDRDTLESTTEIIVESEQEEDITEISDEITGKESVSNNTEITEDMIEETTSTIE